MNSDSEAWYSRQLLTWLQPVCDPEPPNGDAIPTDGVEDPLELNAASSGIEGSGFSPQNFELGEIPAVHDRFQAVLKRRLQVEIQNRPPLFPWETQVCEYSDVADTEQIELVPAQLWTAHQQNLFLPIPLPASVFARLLNQCQAVGRIKSPLQLGAKLVQAVEDLFPGQSQALNQLAGVVMMSPSRSGALESPEAAIPQAYETATPPQQMVLSLLAARQLLDALTLPLSPQAPVAKRQWQTEAGVLKLQAQYQIQGKFLKLGVEGKLPCGGNLKLEGERESAIAHRADSGSLNVELSCDAQPNQIYSLEIQFPEVDLQPLIFTICPTV